MSCIDEKTRIHSNHLLTFPLDKKTVLWFSGINKYLIAQPPADEIIQHIWQGEKFESIENICIEKLGIEKEQAKILVTNIRQYADENLSKKKFLLRKMKYRSNFSPESTKFYQISDVVFYVEFETAQAEELNHPKFAHFEILPQKQFDHYFKIFHSDGLFSLWVDGEFSGEWKEEKSHFLGGKFSMQILQKIYGRKEKEWLGIFHAAGVTDGENCLIFMGGSGDGKSTLSAILLANGLDILADDFLPVDSRGLVCRFPAAISIKKQSYDILIPQFHELKHSIEYHNPVLQKTFRYLPLLKSNQLCVPCKAFIFVKYKKDAGFNLSRISSEEAFRQMIPDSWISPEPKNVRQFMSWFSSLPCYRLCYSDNKKMIQTIKSKLKSELL